MMQRLALSLSLVSLSNLALAYGLGPVKQTRLADKARVAARYLVSTKLAQGGWSWAEGERKGGRNYSGLVAEAMLGAYEQSGDPRFVDAARSYGHELVRYYRQHPQGFAFKPEVEFLVRLTEVSGDELFANTAAQLFARQRRRAPTGADEVRRIVQGRQASPDLVGYDVALGMRAALAVGDRAYAAQLADAVLARRDTWLREPRGVFGSISRAALVDALATLGEPRHQATLRRMRKELIDEQADNGSWCFNSTQTTAYAVRALSQLDDAEAHRASMRGAQWLSQTQLGRGAWAHYNDGLPEPFVGQVVSEVQAEALAAVIMASQL